MSNSSFSFLPFKGVFNDLLSLPWLSPFVLSAGQHGLSLSLSLDRSLDSSLSLFHVAYVTHSFRERFGFVQKKYNADVLIYEPGRRRTKVQRLGAPRWKLNKAFLRTSEISFPIDRIDLSIRT